MFRILNSLLFAILVLFSFEGHSQAPQALPASAAPANAPAPEANPPAPSTVPATTTVIAPIAPPATGAPPVVPRKALRSTRSADFNLPLTFDPKLNSVKLMDPEIDYDLTLNEGRSLRIGNVTLTEKSFAVVLRPLAEINANVAGIVGEDGKRSVLVMRWPESLIKEGQLEMISRSGTVLWKYDITEKAMTDWKAKLEGWKTLLRERGVRAQEISAGLFTTQIMIDGLRGLSAPFWNQSEVFRFCLSRTVDRSQSRLCTHRYSIKTSGDQVRMVRVPSSTPPRVVLMNKNAPLKDTVAVPFEQLAQFYADLAGGESYEFISIPTRPSLVDLSDTSKPTRLRVSGFGIRPTEPNIILNPENHTRLTTLLGFEPTIGDLRKFWAAGMKAESPLLHFPGEGGGLFRQRFDIKDVPRNGLRVHLAFDTIRSTYIDGAVLTGKKFPASKVTSKEHATYNDKNGGGIFEWEFKAAQKGEINRSYLNVNYEGKNYRSFFELYRGYGNELSGRVSGILTGAGLIFMGEAAYNHWFENWFGWNHDLITRQRWGLSAKYFKSLTKLPVGGGQQASLDVMTVDLKYRFTPGLWTRDESVGAMIGYQNVNYDVIKAPMLGVGAFWARSMPRVFDAILSWFPYMDYPKWVDMEFVYYASSMNKNVVLNNTMALNFHGQVLWKKNFFGEAGFGFKRYGFMDASQNTDAKLNTIYGTVGMGIKF